MPMPGPNDGKKRMSRGVKLALMGVGGAALLYSCAPAIGGRPWRAERPALAWGMSNPFYRPPVAQNCGPAVPGSPACAPNQASSSSSSGSSGSGYRGSGSSSTSSTSSTTSGSSSASIDQLARRIREHRQLARLVGFVLMRREAVAPRPGWQSKLDQLGFDYYMLDGKAYWTEQACYAFSSDEVDQLEAATETLHELCLKAVEYVVANKLWERMRIPPAWGDYIETRVAAHRPDARRPLRPRL